MAVQSLGVGTTANDGSGDTLRAAGAKINDNFSEIYTKFGDASSLSSGISATATVVTLTAPTITGAVGGTQTSATITTLANTTINTTTVNAGTMTLGSGAITDSSGAISFGDENLTTNGTITAASGFLLGQNGTIIFEGANDDANETTLTVSGPTADRTITIPDETGTLLTTGVTDTITGNMLKSSSTLLIVDSSGSTLKTVIGAGSAS